jgi:hypothetical protein
MNPKLFVMALVLALSTLLSACVGQPTLGPNEVAVTMTFTPSPTATRTPCAQYEIYADQNGPRLHVDQTFGCPTQVAPTEIVWLTDEPAPTTLWGTAIYSCRPTAYADLYIDGAPMEEMRLYIQNVNYRDPDAVIFKPDGQDFAQSAYYQPEPGWYYIWGTTVAPLEAAIDRHYAGEVEFRTQLFWMQCQDVVEPTATPTITSTPTPTISTANQEGTIDDCNAVVYGDGNTVVVNCGNSIMVQPTASHTPLPTVTPSPTATWAPLYTATPCAVSASEMVCSEQTPTAEEWDENPMGVWQTPVCTPTPACDCALPE